VHQFSTGEHISGVTCMDWALSLTSRKRKSVSSKKGLESWEDLLGDESLVLDSKPVMDLPRDLTLIDIETSLPKLSVLTGGTS
jgi:anaphase-promoting complex subunit 4